jgi:predicted permease
MNGKTYTQSVFANGQTSYAPGQVIMVYISNSNPQDVIMYQTANIWIGILLIIFGLFVIIGTFMRFFLTKKSKFYAAATGFGDIVHTI